jgi:hypothetical protein
VIDVLLSNGDRAEAPDPRSAIVAARELMHEAADAGAASVLLRASFYVDDSLVRCDVQLAELASCLLKEGSDGER